MLYHMNNTFWYSFFDICRCTINQVENTCNVGWVSLSSVKFNKWFLKIEAVAQSCSLRKMFLEILQN